MIEERLFFMISLTMMDIIVRLEKTEKHFILSLLILSQKIQIKLLLLMDLHLSKMDWKSIHKKLGKFGLSWVNILLV